MNDEFIDYNIAKEEDEEEYYLDCHFWIGGSITLYGMVKLYRYD